jgi:hypothetical protein
MARIMARAASMVQNAHAMNDDDETLGPRTRIALVVFGALSWLGGGVGAYVADNDIASTALVVGGVGALLVAAIGRWPSTISVGGNEASWRRRLAEQVEQEIDAAPPEAEPALRSIQRQLEQPLSTSSGPAAYDRRVVAAIEHVLPGATIRPKRRAGTVSDFELTVDGSVLLIETKYVKPPAKTFSGRTLDPLLAQLATGPHLLVVSNAPDVDVARDKVRRALGAQRAEVVSWRNDDDDAALLAAIERLTGSVRPPA